MTPRVAPPLVARLFERSKAARWGVPAEQFQTALEVSVAHAFSGKTPALAGERQSLFRYFHGRSSLATWLRAVLSQRLVDRIRQNSRLDPLLDDDGVPLDSTTGTRGSPVPDPDRVRHLALMRLALIDAI